ncbi:hypothetical protein BLI708_06575 [Bifidobacterium imperatoris]|uniref:Uncharacterized protein n=1 Tax=Bifidobacterium imperatoris TaxID=2020965 RepID=A0A2N5IQX8_9BIFI|nr:hypothetical protein [Bifidobacterium imperatoris]PLS24362.1 hypothetical protein Tam1G_1626 [Bifidobacterium imperatoris]QSY56938.1 hypothetical protein BLI708_06575 [Bifidobacterium imperatoris]
MNAHQKLLFALAVLAVVYVVLLFVAPIAAPVGAVLTAAGLVLVSTRYVWRPKFLALFEAEESC